MFYFRAGCIALLFITIPALASEIRGVPEGNRVFWFVVFPVTCLMFPVFFGGWLARNDHTKEYLTISMAALMTQLVFIVYLYSIDYFTVIMSSVLVQAIVPSVVYSGIYLRDEEKIVRTAGYKVCIGGMSIAVTAIVWYFLKSLFVC